MGGPYYRRPRGFLGSFDYDRYPCRPFLNFTGWPGPNTYEPTRETAVGSLTAPVTAPTIVPVSVPTVTAKEQIVPTVQPSDQSQSNTSEPELSLNSQGGTNG